LFDFAALSAQEPKIGLQVSLQGVSGIGQGTESLGSRVGIYLPIAEMSVNVFVLLAMGAAVGFLSGMFGVGGGFLITPLLIFYNIPPAIAVATGANQVIASSFSGALAHLKRGTLDFKLGTVLLLGGIVGSTVGAYVCAPARLGQLDLFISIFYVVFLGTVGGLMLVESVNAMRKTRGGNAPAAEEVRPAQLDPPTAAEDAVPHIKAVRQRHPSPWLGAASASSPPSWASAAASSWCRR
jgi:hypothetical protein